MHHIIETLSSFIRSPSVSGTGTDAPEPLDHPCLVSAPQALIDDLPLPAYSIASDGSITLVTEG
ncbi:hypothetical protein [Cypionkella sp.]|uniref:hypothetical protein n=1 Tax=Cypionkella sp. TaxID=2811411 RepID=UPI002AB86F6D|nr:hypothetical protein [Cypionkella sp.]MDZ4395143.1 hypothetical protein [Cypionkella sp.]